MRTGRFLREKLISDHGLLSSYESQQGAANRQDSWGVFQGCTGLSKAGCWFARRLHQLKGSTTMDLGISIFLISALRVALRNLGFLIKTDLSALLLRTLAVGRRQHFESIEVALDME